LFVLYLYSALKPACQGLTKSLTLTTVHFISIVTIFTSGVRAVFLGLHFNSTPVKEMCKYKLAGDSWARDYSHLSTGATQPPNQWMGGGVLSLWVTSI
jgi:hypothetical protein